MKTAFAASALAMVASTEAFVPPTAARGSLSPSNSLQTSRAATSAKAAPSMEFAGGLIGAAGPEPNSKNFDPLGFAEAKPENVLFYREAEIKVCAAENMRSSACVKVTELCCVLFYGTLTVQTVSVCFVIMGFGTFRVHPNSLRRELV